MNKKIAFLFPGQGAQYPGMGKDFFSQFSVAQQTFAEADDLLKFSLSKRIFEGSQEELKQTRNSQLAIFVTTIAIYRSLQKVVPEISPSYCAGLSLGEYSALVASNRLSFKDGIYLVQARANFMDEACQVKEGAMVAVLGLETNQVEDAVKDLQIWVANLNCPGQIVISGLKEDMEEAISRLKEKGAKRGIYLDVSGAFHSPLMKEAKNRLKPFILGVPLRNETEIKLIMNVSGKEPASIQELKQNIIDQITHPVRWQDSIQQMVNEGVDLFIEIGPGKILLGFNKKIGLTSPTLNVDKIDEIQVISNHLENYVHAKR
ncbi:MAG: ACP S-malonyltransferase [Chlamydiae bacterium]|nr:ACP S-malonyltransferase [Chlamydiota bacterium]